MGSWGVLPGFRVVEGPQGILPDRYHRGRRKGNNLAAVKSDFGLGARLVWVWGRHVRKLEGQTATAQNPRQSSPSVNKSMNR